MQDRPGAAESQVLAAGQKAREERDSRESSGLGRMEVRVLRTGLSGEDGRKSLRWVKWSSLGYG